MVADTVSIAGVLSSMTDMVGSTLALAAPEGGAAVEGHAGAAAHGAAGPWWVMLIPFLPLIGVGGIAVLAASSIKTKLPAWITLGTLLGSFALTVLLYLGWDGHTALTVHAFDWINFSWGEGSGQTFAANFSFYMDGLSILWMLFVAGLASAICFYASEYMEHDVGLGYCRFFAAFGLFVFSMSCLVMGDNLLLLFLGWEGVGLCSYLLIGYYYKRPAAVAAAKKAFIVNRIGDLGLLLGVLLTYVTFGTIEFEPLFGMINGGIDGSGRALEHTWQVWAIPLLLCMGAFGKSAQIFFYVWLPDAMEGPTPVSALIHAATMVTAGVYLVARMSPLFIADPNLVGLTVVAWSGTITAFWAATIAMAQFDIKRIMGYSTISQLGYMFAGLGFMTTTGGVFHVVTHAFFKATLFLACGAVMHGFAGQLDLRRLSGLRRVPGFGIVAVAMLIGCLNLAGFPFTAGYFSKDMILAEAFSTPDSLIFGSSWLGWLLLVTAGLTAYYTFRVFFRVFVGPVEYHPGDEVHGHDDDHANGHADAHATKDDAGADLAHGHTHVRAEADAKEEEQLAEQHGHFHPHAPRFAINSVLVVLSICSILAAGLYFINKADHGWTGKMVHASSAYVETPAHFLKHAEQTAADGFDEAHAHAGHGVAAALVDLEPGAMPEEGTILGFKPHKAMYYISAVFGVIGIGLAFVLHYVGRTEAATCKMDAIAAKVSPVNKWAENKWYVDEFYDFIIVKPLLLIGHLSHWFDKAVIDWLFVDGTARLPRLGGSVARSAQSGVLHGYALRMAGGVAVVLVIVVLLTM